MSLASDAASPASSRHRAHGLANDGQRHANVGQGERAVATQRGRVPLDSGLRRQRSLTKLSQLLVIALIAGQAPALAAEARNVAADLVPPPSREA